MLADALGLKAGEVVRDTGHYYPSAVAQGWAAPWPETRVGWRQELVPSSGDVVLTDVYLKGELTGKDLLHSIRHDFGYAKGLLPVLVMTGDANPANQSDLLRAGANDLVQKPIEERLLVTKLLFQLRVGRMLRAKLGV